MLKDSHRPVELTHAPRLRDALECLRTQRFNAILLDLNLPDSEGMNTFLRARAEAMHAPIVVLTGVADEEVAARAVREGAQDYLVKAEVDGPLLYRSIRYAVERHASDEAIRRSEALYRNLIEGSIQGVDHSRGRRHPAGQPGPGLDARPRTRRGADRPAGLAVHRAAGSRDGAGLRRRRGARAGRRRTTSSSIC